MQILINKQVYLRLSILEISKNVMFVHILQKILKQALILQIMN